MLQSFCFIIKRSPIFTSIQHYNDSVQELHRSIRIPWYTENGQRYTVYGIIEQRIESVETEQIAPGRYFMSRLSFRIDFIWNSSLLSFVWRVPKCTWSQYSWKERTWLLRIQFCKNIYSVRMIYLNLIEFDWLWD